MHAAADRGAAWVVGMASSDGGWAAFDADNTRELVRTLPFCDFGAVIDPPSADVTAHVVEMLAPHAGEPRDRGIDWLLARAGEGRLLVRPVGRQPRVRHRRGGAGPGRSGGPGARAGDPAGGALAGGAPEPGRRLGRGHPLVHRPALDRAGTSTASQTAWALLALVAAGALGGAAERGIRFLVETQRPDGSWDEPQFTGTGFPGDFSINYHLYRLVFPLSALGRYAEATR